MSETTRTTAPVDRPPGEDDDPTTAFESLLASGERVHEVRRRHWFTFVDAGRWFVLSVGAGIVLLLLGRSVPDDGAAGFLNTGLGWAFWAFLLVGLGGVAWYYVAWRLERYLVTTRRVIESGGVINKYTRDTTLAMITDMIVTHPWIGRILGFGEIELLTASEQGTTTIRFLPRADAFKKSLLDAKHEYELEVGGGRALEQMAAAAGEASASRTDRLSADELDATLSRLADLRERGLVSDAEFEAKKRDLLDRL